MITSLENDTEAAASIDAFATHGCDVRIRFDLLILLKSSGWGKRTRHGRDHLLQACGPKQSQPLFVSQPFAELGPFNASIYQRSSVVGVSHAESQFLFAAGGVLPEADGARGGG
jgi:hypothetical protein